MSHFLRFPNEATGLVTLDAAGLLTEEGEYITASHDHALDVIGDIADLPGWHVNYQGELSEELEQFIVTPSSPYRVFA